MQKYISVPKPDKNILKYLKINNANSIFNVLILDSKNDYELFVNKNNSLALSTNYKIEYISNPSIIIITENIDLNTETIVYCIKNNIDIFVFTLSDILIGKITQIKFEKDVNEFVINDYHKLLIIKNTLWSMIRNEQRFFSRHARNKKIELDPNINIKYNYLLDEIRKKETYQQIITLKPHLNYYKYLSEIVLKGYKEDEIRKILSLKNDLLTELINIFFSTLGVYKDINNRPISYDGIIIKLIIDQFRVYLDSSIVRLFSRQQITSKDFKGWNINEDIPQKIKIIIREEIMNKLKERFKYPFLDIDVSYLDAIYIQVLQYKLYVEGKIDKYFAFEKK